MVDVSSVGVAASNAYSTGISVMGIVVILILFLAIAGFGIGYLFYVRSFNIDVILVRFANGTDIRTGLKAKVIMSGKEGEGKDMRLKIFGAKKHKIQYNEEAINPDDLYSVETPGGRIKRMLFMGIDSEGKYVPLSIKPEMYTYIRDKKDQLGNKIGEEKYSTPVLRANYKMVDVAWYQTQVQKFKHLFQKPDSMHMWMLIIVSVVIVFCLIAFMYNTHKTTQAMEQVALASESIARATQALATNLTGNAPSAQPIYTVITS